MDGGKTIVVSAPGKVILHGEHAVVHGKTAIAASLGLRTCIRLKHTNDNVVRFQLPDVFNVDCQWTCDSLKGVIHRIQCTNEPKAPTEEQLHIVREFVEQQSKGHMPKDEPASIAAAAFIYLFVSIFSTSSSVPAFDVRVRSQLPIGAGLGSSAAYSVVVAASLLCFAERVHTTYNTDEDGIAHTWTGEDAELINQFGFVAEKVIHGNPSGIDNAVACFGGAIRFTKGKEQLPLSMPPIRICLANTKVPRSTKALVAEVGRRKELIPAVINPILDACQAISDECLRIFEVMQNPTTSLETSRECFSTLEIMVDINHHLLVALGVGHRSLEKLCAISAERGFHTKLTGAGGGGCALTLVPEEIEHKQLELLVEELEKEGFECWETDIGCTGVSRHGSEPAWLA